VGDTQRVYGETRRQILTIIIAETGLTDLNDMNVEINKQLEEFMNMQFAMVAVAKHYHINLRTVTESLREQIEWEETSWENDESWEIHWRKCQSGFMRCRSAARRAAKERILQGAGELTGEQALERFNRFFKVQGNVETAISSAVEEGMGDGVEAWQINQPNYLRHQPPQTFDFAGLNPERHVSIAVDDDAAHAVLLPQEPESPAARGLRLQEEAEAKAFRQWKKEQITKSLTSSKENEERLQQNHRETRLFQATQENGDIGEAGEAVAVDAIAAATGRPKDEVFPLLTEQLKRFRFFAEAVRETSDLLRARAASEAELLRPSRNPIAARSREAIELSPMPGTRGDNDMPSSILQQTQSLFSGADSPLQFSHQEQERFSRGDAPEFGSNLKNRPLNSCIKQKTESQLSLRELYARALNEESLIGGENGMRFSVQIDRPVMWVDVSLDPKYTCAGWSATAYSAWKEHAEKRKAQGAPQRYVTYITLPMVDMICMMTRTTPEALVALSDEALTLKLDLKFNIAQETNLLMMKFIMPARPAILPTWELHLPTTEFSNYVLKWLKELRSQQEAGKDLEKYDLSDVFTQSLLNFKLLYDHSRMLTKLPVRDLIASCSDYLQEQVISEQKSANARKQCQQTGNEAPPKDVVPENTGRKDHGRGLTTGNGVMSLKQARAFMTEASALARPGANVGAGAARPSTPSNLVPRDFLVAFIKLSFFDINCEGCGKWYKNAPDKKFPNPCSGRCQYEGHPEQNLRYQKGIKWKYPGFCCSWKGMQDHQIPSATLLRLQKYSASKRPAHSTA